MPIRLPDDPADRPWDDDEPIDSLSFVEVCNEAREKAIDARKHAMKMMFPFALRALLDGASAEEVAEACGFPRERRKRPQSVDLYTMVTSQMLGMVMEDADGEPSDPVQALTQWLKEGLDGFIKERSESS
jgi:hypothetical protein